MTQSILRLGTRGSRLALVQAGMVRDALAGQGLACEIATVRTTGDAIQDRPLAAFGGKGLFVKELEEALLDGRIDLAVHSMKDLPVLLPEGLGIAALLPREDPRDVFVSPHAGSLTRLAQSARVGTSSVRRQAQVMRARPDVTVLPLRGNVDTRLAKLACGEMDAVILAYAGLKRLGLQSRVTAILSTEEWLPALSQGAIGIEMRADDARFQQVAALDDRSTAIALACERGFQEALGGSCTTSIAGFAQVEDDVLQFRGEVLAPDGSDDVETVITKELRSGGVARAAELGRQAGLGLRPRAIQWLNL